MSELLEQFQALEETRIASMVARDFEGLDRCLSENLVYGHSTGSLDTKTTMLKLLRESAVEYISIDSELDVAVPLGVGVVLISGMLTTRAKVLGEFKEFMGRYMAVWREHGGQWKLEALQGSKK